MLAHSCGIVNYTEVQHPPRHCGPDARCGTMFRVNYSRGGVFAPFHTCVDTMDEAALIDGIHRKDAESLAQFIESKRHPLLAYIERRLGFALRKKVEAEDMLQELSAEALRSLPVIDLGDRDPFGWLCQLAERRIIDAHRRFASQK